MVQQEHNGVIAGGIAISVDEMTTPDDFQEIFCKPILESVGKLGPIDDQTR